MNAQSTEAPPRLRIIVLPSALITSIVFWIVFGALAFVATEGALLAAILIGLLVVILYWASELAHHLGHARAAQGTGYPMQAIKLGGIWGILALSCYPPNEPVLPDSVHLRRALGGPIASLIMALIFGAFALIARGGPFEWALILLFCENAIFAIQVVIPLGKLLDNDGNTLLRWWRGRKNRSVVEPS